MILITSCRACSTIRPATLITAKRIAFILFAVHDSPKPNFFIAVFRLKARTVIHHQLGIYGVAGIPEPMWRYFTPSFRVSKEVRLVFFV